MGVGSQKLFEVKNKTPATIPRAYDGAVVTAVIAILKDPDIHYLAHRILGSGFRPTRIPSQ